MCSFINVRPSLASAGEYSRVPLSGMTTFHSKPYYALYDSNVNECKIRYLYEYLREGRVYCLVLLHTNSTNKFEWRDDISMKVIGCACLIMAFINLVISSSSLQCRLGIVTQGRGETVGRSRNWQILRNLETVFATSPNVTAADKLRTYEIVFNW